ncbi:MAG: thioredoxin domain-containing protein [Desulfuromonadaceae bacterium]|nr:thioredoxin domain-containing protein [Desulfuromonadaceae bacterium]
MRVSDINSPKTELWESNISNRFPLSALVVLWLGVIAGLVFSVMSALNICTSACNEVSLYTIFGLNFGWFGVVFFTLLMGMLVLVRRFVWSEMLIILLVSAAAGAELRFIWLQKYEIGKWCPLCLSIAAAIYLMAIVLLLNKWNKMQSRRANMKTYLKFITTVMLAAVIGLSGAVLGVKKVAEAAELNMFLGKTDSHTVVYFINDWFCPACRRTEPAIAKMFPKIAAIAKVGFVDIPVHPETTNFTPYNTQFLLYEKGKYIQLRGALAVLAKKTKTPSPEDVQKAIAPYGVKLRSMNFADIESGMNWNEKINRTYEIKATPTVVVMNEKTGKHVNLEGREDISYEGIIKAIAEMGK